MLFRALLCLGLMVGCATRQPEVNQEEAALGRNIALINRFYCAEGAWPAERSRLRAFAESHADVVPASDYDWGDYSERGFRTLSNAHLEVVFTPHFADRIASAGTLQKLDRGRQRGSGMAVITLLPPPECDGDVVLPPGS